MFCINIALGSTSWRLLFKEEEKATLAFDMLRGCESKKADSAFTWIEDDFGQKLYCPYASIHGVMFEDLDQTKQAHIAMALHQARTQHDAQTAAQSDPVLRQGMRSNGPAIISPMGNGARPF